MLLSAVRVFLSTSPTVLRRGSFLLPATTPGGPRRCKAALWLQPRAPQLPSLGRLYSAQDGARPDFGHRPRQAAVAGFGP